MYAAGTTGSGKEVLMKKEKTDELFEDFLCKRNDLICGAADDIIMKCEGCEGYTHNMYWTAMVIDFACTILDTYGYKSCYPGYTEYEDSDRIPCYRDENCDIERCPFLSGKDEPGNDLLSVLSNGECKDGSLKNLLKQLNESIATFVAPKVKEALDGEV